MEACTIFAVSCDLSIWCWCGLYGQNQRWQRNQCHHFFRCRERISYSSWLPLDWDSKHEQRMEPTVHWQIKNLPDGLHKSQWIPCRSRHIWTDGLSWGHQRSFFPEVAHLPRNWESASFWWRTEVKNVIMAYPRSRYRPKPRVMSIIRQEIPCWWLDVGMQHLCKFL